MAKIVEEIVVIKISKLVRDEAKNDEFLPDEFVAGIEAMATEMLSDPSAIIEVIKGDD